MRRGGDADYAFKAMLLKAEAQRRQGSFGGEAATPPCLVQLETDFDLVHIRPVFELIETNLADPATDSPVDSRPRAVTRLHAIGASWLQRASRFGRAVGFARP